MTNTEISDNNPEKELIISQFQMIKPNKLVGKIQRKIKKLHQKMKNQLNLLMIFLMKFLEISFQKKTL